jgi:hypothetical protein
LIQGRTVAEEFRQLVSLPARETDGHDELS